MSSKKGWSAAHQGTSLPPSLLVSFWDVALNNFPEGNFCHRELERSEAVNLINAVQANGTVHFGTDHDLAAPYKERRLDQAKELIGVLSSLGIDVQIDDFFCEVVDGVIRYAVPITLFDIRPDRPMIVVNCAYVIEDRSQRTPVSFAIEPGSVEFHLFEILGSVAPR